jgi:hypothetical protein
MKSQVLLKKGYEDNAEKLFKSITDAHNYTRIYLMTFNYTLPMYKEVNGFGTNVHGYIGAPNLMESSNEVIIGIDHRNIKAMNTNEYMFTKTSRKLYYQDETIRNQSLPLKNDVESIIFYGHSLGTADFSYFQTLFDYYDLYSGNVKIVFAYTEIDNQSCEKHTTSIMRLLDRYGESMRSEPDKGKNLIHKLLLEHRLQIKRIEALNNS